jgi:hypothetical protein
VIAKILGNVPAILGTAWHLEGDAQLLYHVHIMPFKGRYYPGFRYMVIEVEGTEGNGSAHLSPKKETLRFRVMLRG